MNIISLEDLFNNISQKIEKGEKLQNLSDLLKNYSGSDWKNYVSFNKNKYTRNLVKKDNNIEIIIICWNEGQISGVHDHPKNGCLMKVLEGMLKEDIYYVNNKITKYKHSKVGILNDIFYQEGSTGLHNIVNYKNKTITLHVYSPPNYKPEFF
jgi:cysteine dioxygenase